MVIPKEDIKNLPNLQTFIKSKYRSSEILIIDADFAHDQYMNVFYKLQQLFKEDKVPYGTAQNVLKIMDELNWYGLDDVQMYEIFDEEDKINISEISEQLEEQEGVKE